MNVAWGRPFEALDDIFSAMSDIINAAAYAIADERSTVLYGLSRTADGC